MYHSIFDVWAGSTVIETLENTCKLIDSWVDVEWETGNRYNSRANMGMADEASGAVVFECAQGCADFNIATWECDGADFYSHRVFRIFAHQKDTLSGLADELVILVNDYRDDNAKLPLLENMGLLKAAVRHADDCAENDLSGDVGSDGSTVYSRLTDAGYYLYVRAGVNVYYYEMVEVGVGLTAAGVIGDWKFDPAKNAAMLNANYRDVSAAVTVGDNGKDYLVFMMAGVVNPLANGERWPGFCPVDTAAIDAYMLANFDLTGLGMRLLNVYVV